MRDTRYDDYALRKNVRGDIRQRKDQQDVFSARATRYWSALNDLCQAIAHGDASIGLPPYNGGLFDQARTPLLGQIRLDDAVMATAIDALSFEQTQAGRRYINYRDLGVQQLGSIYERLLEHDLSRERDEITIRLNRLAGKGSGSYYTSDDLVALIIKETIEPLVRARIDAFLARCAELATTPLPSVEVVVSIFSSRCNASRSVGEVTIAHHLPQPRLDLRTWDQVIRFEDAIDTRFRNDSNSTSIDPGDHCARRDATRGSV